MALIGIHIGQDIITDTQQGIIRIITIGWAIMHPVPVFPPPETATTDVRVLLITEVALPTLDATVLLPAGVRSVAGVRPTVPPTVLHA